MPKSRFGFRYAGLLLGLGAVWAAAIAPAGPAAEAERRKPQAPPTPKSAPGAKEPHAMPSGPPKHGRWEPMPLLTDEFEGTALDPAKWHPSNPQWKGRQPGFFATQNVTVSDGKLHITMKREDLPNLPKGYHTYTCGAVKSKTKVRYGYFEVQCRPMPSRGSSAFWFYDGTPEVWTEIDMFEIGGGAPKHEDVVHMNAHVFHTPAYPDRHWSKGGDWKAPYRLADGYHVYALEWDPKELKYYVDGAVVRTMPNTHWHQPLYLNFDSETMPEWFGLPEPGTLPSTFSTEYVRAWKRLDGPPEDRIRSCRFLFPGAKGDAVKGKTVRFPVPAGDGRVLVVASFGGATEPQCVHLEYDDPAFFAAQKAQTVEKTVRVKDKNGRELSLTFQWSKVKGEKQNNGYRAQDVRIVPIPEGKRGTEGVYDLAAENAQDVRVIVEH